MMICNECGSDLAHGAKFCNTCGSAAEPRTALSSGRRQKLVLGTGSWAAGTWIVVWELLTLPLGFVRDTFRWLGEIGEQRSLSFVGDPELPFLNWTVVAGRVLVTTGAFLLFTLTVIWGLAILAQGEATGVVVLIMAPLVTWAFVWFLAEGLEFVFLLVRVPKHLQSIRDELTRLNRP